MSMDATTAAGNAMGMAVFATSIKTDQANTAKIIETLEASSTPPAGRPTLDYSRTLDKLA